MKKFEKLLAVILSFMLILGTLPFMASADDTFTDAKLNTRSDFLWGISMHNPSMNNYAYPANDLVDQIHLAAEMGTKLIRIDYNINKSYVEDAITLCNAYGIKVMLNVGIDGLSFTEARDASELEAITASFKAVAEHFSDANGLGIDYIQIGNEMDCALIAAKYGTDPAPEGSAKGHFEEEHIDITVAQVNAAIEGIKSGNSDISTVINFTWKHYGMLEWFAEKGVDYDIIGHGWYGNMYDTANEDYYTGIGTTLTEKFNKPIIITEANIRATQEIVDRESTDPTAADWDDLVNCMNEAYAMEDVIGFTFYELVDQSDKQQGDTFNREAYCGLLKYDADKTLTKKPIYNRLKYIIGGKTLEKLTGPNAVYTHNLYAEYDEIYLKATRNNPTDSGYRILTAQTYQNSTRFAQPIDLSYAQYIEFDLYLSEDIKTFNMYLGVDGPMANGVEGTFYDWPNRAAAVLGEMTAGWHHITFAISGLQHKEENFDLTKVTGFIFTAYNGTNADGTTAAIPNFDIRTTNFALTRDIPYAWVTYENHIYQYADGLYSYDEGLFNQGAVATTAAMWGGNWLFDGPDTCIDATDADFFEFDIYVSADTQPATVWMSNYISRANGRNAYTLPALKGGVWNHVCIDISSVVQKVGTFAPASFNSIIFEGPLSKSASVTFKVANVGVSKFEPEAVYEYNVVTSYDEIALDYTYQTGKDGNTYGQLYWSTAFASNLYMNNTMFDAAVDFNKADYLEFDVYFSQKPENDFWLYASNRGWALNPPRAKADIKVDGFDVGWNHVVIAIKDFYDISEGSYNAGGVVYTFDWSCITGMSLEGKLLNDMTGGVRLAISNFALTTQGSEKQEMSYIGNLFSTYDGYEQQTVDMGTNLNSLSPIAFGIPADLTDTAYIEMNLYVTAKCDITIHLNSAETVEDFMTEYSAVKTFTNLSYGWNQLHIVVSDIINGENDWVCNEWFDSTYVAFISFEGTPSNTYDVEFAVEDIAITADLGYELRDGDFNADGNVNILDLIRVKKNIAASNDVFFANVAEFDGESCDGELNIEDLTMLRKSLLGI